MSELWTRRLANAAVGCLLASSLCAAQEAAPAPPPSADANTATLAERQERNESTAIFHAKVNLVLVPVVVRNNRGEAIGTLTQDKFLIYDNGRATPIKSFEIETPASRKAKLAARLEAAKDATAATSAATAPTHFIAYIFDDEHMDFAQVVQVRTAITNQLKQILRPSDRVAFYTTSGETMLEFTDDPAKIVEALGRVVGRTDEALSRSECPRLNELAAQQIDEFGESGAAYDYAAQETMNCSPELVHASAKPSGGGNMRNVRSSDTNNPNADNATIGALIRAEVSLVMERQRRMNAKFFTLLREVTRRMSAMPGERTVLLASPGFLTRDEAPISEIIEHATHDRIIVNTLDSRGLFTPAITSGADEADGETPAPQLMIERQRYASLQQITQNAVLREFAEATGGEFTNNNDFEGAVKRASETPEAVYLIGFAPQNLKHNGSYHKLKVQINGARGLTVQARHGYSAPTSEGSPDEEMKAAVREAMFSQDEVREIPVSLQTQFYKTEEYKASLNLLLTADLGALPMKHADGRYIDTLGFYAALFDANGDYVAGMGKTIDLHLKEETAQRMRSNIVVRGSIETQTGNYLLRVVLRDSEGEQVAAITRAINIP